MFRGRRITKNWCQSKIIQKLGILVTVSHGFPSMKQPYPYYLSAQLFVHDSPYLFLHDLHSVLIAFCLRFFLALFAIRSSFSVCDFYYLYTILPKNSGAVIILSEIESFTVSDYANWHLQSSSSSVLIYFMQRMNFLLNAQHTYKIPIFYHIYKILIFHATYTHYVETITLVNYLYFVHFLKKN